SICLLIACANNNEGKKDNLNDISSTNGRKNNKYPSPVSESNGFEKKDNEIPPVLEDPNNILEEGYTETISITGKETPWEVVTFGRYEQDNDLTNGPEPIEWYVLTNKFGKMLLLSKYGLDGKQYNETVGDVTWDNCTLRKWLNEEFYNISFNQTEKGIILSTKLPSATNLYYGTYGGKETDDKVFLLSYEDCVNYEYGFIGNSDKSDPALICYPTLYAMANGVERPIDKVEAGLDSCTWWIRSPGSHLERVCTGEPGGFVMYVGYYANSNNAVRPALVIDINNYENNSMPQNEGDTIQQDVISKYLNINYEGYIFPSSDRRYITEDELIGLSSFECKIARNEIYARLHRKFIDETIQQYFNSKEWYSGYREPDEVDDSWLNVYEKANVNLIKNYEEKGCPNSDQHNEFRPIRTVKFASWGGDSEIDIYLEYTSEKQGFMTFYYYDYDLDNEQLIAEISERYAFVENNDLEGTVYDIQTNQIISITYKITDELYYGGGYDKYIPVDDYFVINLDYYGDKISVSEALWAYEHVG
ncbi:MAG: YARHG domain-containing protein, partial [Lachnospiraceae bacterium]|nr:YARHG domain-containing protein [Lachnospiraceae bacterium]